MTEDEIKSRGNQQALVVEVCAALSENHDVGAALDRVLASIRGRARVTRAAVHVLNVENRLLRCVAESGIPSVEASRSLGIDGPGLAAEAARTGRAVYLPDVMKDARALCDDPGTRSEYAIPLLRGNTVLGVLDLQSNEPDGIRAVTRKLLDQIAAQIALALERSELGKRLRAAEERFAAIFEQGAFGVALLDLEGRYTTVNPAFARQLGFEPEELRGQPHLDRIHPEDRERARESVRQLIEGVKNPAGLERRYLDKSGAATSSTAVEVLLCDAAGRPASLMAIVENIPERKKTDEERAQLREHLAQAQKMEAVGTLAGGLAHDFNNFLGAILGFASLLRLRMRPDDPLQESVRMIEQSAESAAELPRQLLALTRQEQQRSAPVRVEDALQHVVKIVARTFDRRIKVETKFAPDLPAVEAEAGQLTHALLNLCLNARDAMPEGGKLMLETSRVSLGPEDSIRPQQCPPGDYVRIAVKDTGLGIEPQVMSKIFEPFFTTKGAGRGSGLGLAMVYHMAHTHGGFVRVESEVVHGSQFSIYLPTAGRPALPAHRDEPQSVQYGTGTVLVVDDEPMILAFAERGLGRLGYDVLMADNGRRACEIYAQRSKDIDYVLLDMMMPEMSGLETYQKLREINPQAKIILSSGYSVDQVAREAVELGAAEFIGKPYSLERLSLALKKAQEE